jgi:putative ABC transport system permease protein
VARLEDVVSDSIATPRFYASILGTFAGVAAIGIYGLISYLVTQRTREIGIRMALGAKRYEVLGLILRQGAILTAIGVLFGLSGAVALTRYLQSMLFGMSALDPETFAAVALAFGIISLVAAYVPARRATKVDPVVALRYE